MTEFEALVGLNMVGDIGGLRLKRLLEFFSKPQDILNAPLDKLLRIKGIGEITAQKIHDFKKEELARELSLARKKDLKIITLRAQEYPLSLKQIPDSPPVLYIKGEFTAQDNRALAIVGSRYASFYGMTCAQNFAAGLAQEGFTIVSGMARGIDTCAHKGALKSGGRTIAVIGSGFNQLYPEENKGLAEQISKSGAVISEFPLDTLPFKQNFPRRNRVISGLSLGVLVVEAAQRSGALITADFALEQGREVFALPGKIDADNSLGTNGLIKQGAKLVSCIEDILEEFSTVRS